MPTDPRAEVEEAFRQTNRMYVRLPEQGADSLDVAIADALLAAERRVLAILARPAPPSEGLDVERLAISAAARLEGEVSALRTERLALLDELERLWKIEAAARAYLDAPGRDIQVERNALRAALPPADPSADR